MDKVNRRLEPDTRKGDKLDRPTIVTGQRKAISSTALLQLDRPPIVAGQRKLDELLSENWIGEK